MVDCEEMICRVCNRDLDRNAFTPSRLSRRECRVCHNIRKKQWRQRNRTHCLQLQREQVKRYYAKNREKVLAQRRLSRLRIRSKKPWLAHLEYAKFRCTQPCSNRYEYYGARGIRMLLTPDEIKKLWFRDHANLMRQPTIHRIDTDGHYEINNCCFMERSEHGRLKVGRPCRRKKPLATKCKRGHPFTKKNTVIRKDGRGRACRICRDEYLRNYRLRNKLKKIRL